MADDFDPDAYLSSNPSTDDFDPDAYLGTTKKTASPPADPASIPSHLYPKPPEGIERDYYQGPPVSAMGDPLERDTQRAKNALLGFASGAAQGWYPQLAGAAGAIGQTIAEPIGKALGGQPLDDKSILERYREARDHTKRLTEQAEREDPSAYRKSEFVGSVVGSVPIAKALGGMSMVGQGAVLGGLNALGRSDADLTRGEFSKALKDTDVGAAVGGVTSGLVGAGFKAAGGAYNLAKDGVGNRAKVALGRIAQQPEKLVRKVKIATGNADWNYGGENVKPGATKELEQQIKSAVAGSPYAETAVSTAEKTARTPLDFVGGSRSETGQLMQKELGELAEMGSPNSSIRAAIRYGDDEVQAAAARNAEYAKQLAEERAAKEAAMNTGQLQIYKRAMRAQERLPKADNPVAQRKIDEIKMEWPSRNPVARRKITDEVNTVAADKIKSAPSSLDDLYSFEKQAPAANAPQEAYPKTYDPGGPVENMSTLFHQKSEAEKARRMMNNFADDPLNWMQSNDASKWKAAHTGKDQWSADFPEPSFLGSEHKPMGQDTGKWILEQLDDPNFNKESTLAMDSLLSKEYIKRMQGQRGMLDIGGIGDAMLGYAGYKGIKNFPQFAASANKFGRNMERSGMEGIRERTIKAMQNPTTVQRLAQQPGKIGDAARWALSGDAKGLAARVFVLSAQPAFQSMFEAQEPEASTPPR